MESVMAALSTADQMVSAFIYLSVDVAFMTARLMCVGASIVVTCIESWIVLGDGVRWQVGNYRRFCSTEHVN
jgi:hypothetical protein